MSEFICGGEKYEVVGAALDVISLPLPTPEGLPEVIEIENYKLARKSEFHVSLMYIGKIVEKRGIVIPDFAQKVIGDFCEFVQTTPIEFTTYRDEYRFLTREERRSVVRMCEVSNINQFFDVINSKYNLELDYPPTHVTLYTLLPDIIGISILDSEALQNKTKIIPKPF